MKKIEIKNKKFVVFAACIALLVGIGYLVYYGNKSKENVYESFDLSQTDVVEKQNIEDGKNVEGKFEDSSVEKSENKIYIHIIGEVKNQGIIVLKKGDRIVDAIEKAGGTTENADLSKVNLAYVLSDGQKLRIPNINEKNQNESYISAENGDNSIIEGGNANMKNGGKININNASQTELETITGVGPSIAAKIIQYREKNGKFKKIEELKNVSGIGENKYEGMKDEIEV